MINAVNSAIVNTCLFDFSYNEAQLQSGAGWNNVMSSGDQDFTDINSVKIGHLVSLGWTSANNLGTLAPTAPASNDFSTLTQTQDNIYGQSGGTGTITLSGLDVSKYYSFTVFGSRAGVTDNRETTYTFTGSNTGNASINPSSNNSEVAIINNIQPTSAGEIVFTTTAGPNNVNSSKFFYLAAMKMLVSDAEVTSSVRNTTINNNSKVYYMDNMLSIEDYSGSVKIYNSTGKIIEDKFAVNGKLNIQLSKGMYIIRTETNSTKMIVK